MRLGENGVEIGQLGRTPSFAFLGPRHPPLSGRGWARSCYISSQLYQLRVKPHAELMPRCPPCPLGTSGRGPQPADSPRTASYLQTASTCWGACAQQRLTEKLCSKAHIKRKATMISSLLFPGLVPFPREGDLMSMDLGELCLWPLENAADSHDKKGKLRQVRINEIPAKTSY